MSKPFKFRNAWWIRFTDEFGKRRKRVFDDYAAAAHALTAEKARVREVKIGLRSPTPPTKTFNELADYWVTNRASQKRSGHHDVSIIHAHLRPAFGPMKLKDIGVAEGDRFVCDRMHLDKKTVANLLTLLLTMLNAAVDLGWLLKAPKIRKPKVRLFSKDYRYLRTAEEIARFLRAAFAEGSLVGILYATAVFTGLRAGELAGLTWDKIDFEKRLIVVDHSFEGPTKADDVRYVPILDPLLPLLREWRLKCPGRLLFPNQAGEMHRESARIFQEVLHRVLEAAGFPATEVNGKKRRYIVFHDTRHTFASAWVAGGGDLFKLQKILGHKSPQMTLRYAHLAPSAYAGDHGRLGTDAGVRTGVVVPMVAP